VVCVVVGGVLVVLLCVLLFMLWFGGDGQEFATNMFAYRGDSAAVVALPCTTARYRALLGGGVDWSGSSVEGARFLFAQRAAELLAGRMINSRLVA
jgi:hypothetical protein